jgi:hypothetical protein
MKIAILLAAILLPGFANLAQEHAPTAEQCDADLRLWASQASTLDKLPYKEVEAREQEMFNCGGSVNSQTQQGFIKAKSYDSASNLYRGEMGERLSDFLVRHNLIEQFLAEDAQGKR